MKRFLFFVEQSRLNSLTSIYWVTPPNFKQIQNSIQIPNIALIHNIIYQLAQSLIFSHCRMQYKPFHFYYQGRFPTIKLINDFVHQLEPEDEKNYIDELGQYIYQYKVKDRYSQWTVLKTRDEIVKYMAMRRNSIPGLFTYSKKQIEEYEKKNLGNDSFEIQHFRELNTMSTIPQHYMKFFQMYHPNINKLTSFKMLRKIRGLTRIKKFQNWLLGPEWQEKRIIVTKQGIIQMADNGSVTDFLKFDLYFNIESGITATEDEYGVALYSAQRKVVLKTEKLKDFVKFLYYVKTAFEQSKQGFYYLGSCTRCKNNSVEYIVDAKDYYERVAQAIETAERRIMICGWWISPELYLKRPINQRVLINGMPIKRQIPPNQLQNIKQSDLYQTNGDYYRLDSLLQRKARAGVKIYIIVFLSPSLIPNNSDYTKKALTSLHENIVVERHPHQVLPKLWSHHQKAVIVDQKIALMGGLDLCYGRYDDHSHPIDNNDTKNYPGIDYNNVRIKDFVEVSKWEESPQDRKLPRLPWHDVAYRVQGKLVADVANHFIEYWNFAVLEKKMAPITAKNTENSTIYQKENIGSSEDKFKQRLINAMIKLAIEKNPKLSLKEKEQMEQFIDYSSKKERFAGIAKTQWFKKKYEIFNGAGENCLILSIESLGLIKQDAYQMEQQAKLHMDQLQLLRSASEWSIGLQNGTTQRSIQNAYLSMIKNANHYIYIENQFFISATGQKNSFVSNQIANALYERIKKAIENKQRFRVVVFMPLVPGMEGPLNQQCPLSLKLTMFWQFNTISRANGNSLLERVAKLTDHPEDFIEFYSLRNHGLLSGQPITQIVYIHTKLIIVDDHIALCGSANINDRSQAGDRDSELAVIFTNGAKTVKKTNGVHYQVNEKAYRLRSKLYQEHFGMNAIEAEDPVSPQNIILMRNIAKTNTEMYREIFGCVPDDNVKKFAQVNTFQKVSSKQTNAMYESMRPKFRGHAVEFPSKFLEQEKLYSVDLNKVQDIFI